MQTQTAAAPWPVFVLTLKDDEARRRPLVDALAGRGIAFELVFGVDGRHGLPATFDKHIDRRPHWLLDRHMTDGEFACALSHQAIYRRIVDRGLPGAIVLEDDAIPTDGFAEFLDRRAYRKADIIMLDHGAARLMRRSSKPLMAGVVGRELAHHAMLTTGYSLSARAARFMLANSVPIRRPADWPCDITLIGALATFPRLIEHPPDGNEMSHLSVERKKTSRQHQRRRRFFEPEYWRRKWRKFRSEKARY